MKSTYTNYSVTGGLSNELESLRHGPDQYAYETAVAAAQDNAKGKIIKYVKKPNYINSYLFRMCIY